MTKKAIIPLERIETNILIIRGKKVISKTIKILNKIFYCLIFIGNIVQAADINWYGENVDGTSSLLPGTTMQLNLKLRAVNTSGTDREVTGLIVTFSGTPDNAPHISNGGMQLWVDSDGEWNENETQYGGNQSFNGVSPAKVSFSFGRTINSGLGNIAYFYLTYNLKTSVTEGHTIDTQILEKSDITSTAPTMDGNFPLNSSGSLSFPSYDTIKVIANQYVIDNIAVSQMAGLPFEVKVSAVDEYGNFDLNYSGARTTLSGNASNAPNGFVPSYVSPGNGHLWTGSEGGVYIFTDVVLYCAEEDVKIVAADNGGGNANIGADYLKESNLFKVNPGIKLNLSLPENTPVEEVVDIRIEVNELYNNPYVYTGTVQFTSTDAQAILPVNYAFNEGEMNKVFLRGATFRTSGNQTVEVKDITDSRIAGSGEIIVQSGDKGHKAMNYPNPFDSHKGKTTIQFYMEQEGKVEIKIYTLTGNLVKEWEFNARKGINADFQWDGRDKDGNMVANGTYLCHVKTDNKKETIKIAVIK